MKLSIGMIVKNEEKYLEQCLTGIKQILDNVDSELIIADTGSTDRTVEIAKKFTDNVFHFEWINDFAAARNSTLEKAKGEWYMFVDGDEVFQNCDHIIKFFNSGEYKKYNSASFNIRNYLNIKLDDYADFNGPRLTKILPHTRFLGEIHEFINTYGAPFKRLTDTADHYGYVFDEENDSDEKFKRNSEALLRQYETEKETNSRLYSQLYDCFIGRDPEKAERFFLEGVEVCNKTKSPVLIILYASRIFTAYCNSQFDDVLKYCDEYFRIDKEIRPYELSTDDEVLALKAFAQYNLNLYDKAIATFEKFFDVFKRVKNGKLSTSDSFLGTKQMATDKHFIQILNAFCRCCALADKYNLAAAYLESLPIAKYSIVDDYLDLLIVFEMELLEHFDYENPYKYYKQLDSKGKNLFRERLTNRLYLSENKDKIIDALAAVSKDDDALKEKLVIYKKYFFDGTVIQEDLCSFTDRYGINEYADLFMIAAKKQFDISALFKAEGFDMKLCVYKCYMRVYGFTAAMNEYSIDAVKNADDIPDVLKFFEYCMKMVPVYRSPKPNTFMRLTVDYLFETYSQFGIRYMNDKGIAEDDLPRQVKAAVIADEVIKARREKRFRDCFAAMKKAITTYDGITPAIELYQEETAAEYKESAARPNSADEFKRLAETLKRNIRNLVSAGNIELAEKTLSEYSKLNPNDTEIAELQELIKR